ncbi:hypothetical protein DFQ27_004013 [Actinomortierella ambigua]|uniref:Major facilitator superfamily (MFS) profile domain-containing protein n=1 Tax=Actinomortierella ambigua TaxID=1343610 RepID=A0A9P6U401_9FUNG|nr:hypothetical protein DFQ27_004013 [Actinomortierella ambigua]
MSSKPLKLLHNHYNNVKFNRSERQIEQERYLIGKVPFQRWLMFPAAFIFQAICGSLYAWSVWNFPIDKKFYGSKTVNGKEVALEQRANIAFSIAVGFFGLSAAINGPWLERNGPRKAALIGTSIFFIGNMIAAIGIEFNLVGILYLGYGVVGGAGLGLCYISPVSALQKWFPDKRGMAAGFAVCGFGAGSIALAKVPAPLTAAIGLRNCFITLACCYFFVMILCALVFRVPPPNFQVNGLDMYRNRVNANGDIEVANAAKDAAHIVDPASTLTLTQSIFSREYRFMYLMFFGNSIAGLVFLSRLANIVTAVYGKPPSTGDTVVAINGGFNLAGRLFFSTASDFLGRKNAFIVMLGCQVIVLASLPTLMENQNYPGFLAFIWIMTACYGGGFGCIPAFLCDMFGPSNIGACHGIILTAWAIAGVFGGLLFTAIFDNYIHNGKTPADVIVYETNLRWILGFAALGFIFILFVRTSIRDRLLPPVAGEFTRIRLFGSLYRVGSFGLRKVSKDEEDNEWAEYCNARLAEHQDKSSNSSTTTADQKMDYGEKAEIH